MNDEREYKPTAPRRVVSRATPPAFSPPPAPAAPVAAGSVGGGGGKGGRRIAIVLGCIALVAVVIALYSVQQLRSLKDPAHQQELVEKKTQKIIDELGTLMELPEGTPELAIVVDPEVMKKSQPFLEKALKDDVLVVYPSRAILYRPATKKIINVAAISVQNIQPAETPSVPVTTSTPIATEEKKDEEVVVQKEVRVELRNGSSTVGKAKRYESRVSGLGLVVDAVTSAASSDYAQTVIYTKNGVDASKLEALFGVKATNTFPAKEKEITGDILVIVGEDAL